MPSSLPSRQEQYPVRDTAAYRRILEAAESCFGTLGFQKTTIVEVAAVAQVSKPLVYRYFESKEHLYEVVIGRLFEGWNEELVAELSRATDGGGAPEALRRMHRASLDFARRRSLLRGLLAKEGRLLLASYSDVVERIVTTLKAQIATCLRAGIAAGEVRAHLPVDAMADAVTELHLAYVERIVSGIETPEAERIARDAFECLLFGVCERDDAERNESTSRRKRSE